MNTRFLYRLNAALKLVSGILLMAVLLYSCKASTVLLANFNNDNLGAAPGVNQPTGTILLNQGAGSIIVAAAPLPNQPSTKWAFIDHRSQPTPETTMTGRFTQSGQGKYGLLSSIHIPLDAGVVSVQFEAANSLGSFMHIDFMTEGDVRIDDDENLRFGHFPRNTNFVLSVNLDITSSNATAEITLLGQGASGTKTVNVKPLFLPVARQFGAVKFWVGYQHNAAFFVDDIIVTRKN